MEKKLISEAEENRRKRLSLLNQVRNRTSEYRKRSGKWLILLRQQDPEFDKRSWTDQRRSEQAKRIRALNKSPEFQKARSLADWSKQHNVASELGKVQGRKNVESGRMSELGKVQGRKNVESGLLFNMAKKDTKPELAVKVKLDELVALGVVSGYVHPHNLNNRFFVDFFVPDTNKIIEVDGCYWHRCSECGYGDGRPHDRARNAYIKACGYDLEIVKEHELRRG